MDNLQYLFLPQHLRWTDASGVRFRMRVLNCVSSKLTFVICDCWRRPLPDGGGLVGSCEYQEGSYKQDDSAGHSAAGNWTDAIEAADAGVHGPFLFGSEHRLRDRRGATRLWASDHRVPSGFCDRPGADRVLQFGLIRRFSAPEGDATHTSRVIETKALDTFVKALKTMLDWSLSSPTLRGLAGFAVRYGPPNP